MIFLDILSFLFQSCLITGQCYLKSSEKHQLIVQWSHQFVHTTSHGNCCFDHSCKLWTGFSKLSPSRSAHPNQVSVGCNQTSICILLIAMQALTQCCLLIFLHIIHSPKVDEEWTLEIVEDAEYVYIPSPMKIVSLVEACSAMLPHLIQFTSGIAHLEDEHWQLFSLYRCIPFMGPLFIHY